MFMTKISRYAIALERRSKRLIVVLIDASLCSLTVYVAIYLRIGAVPDPTLPLAGLIIASIALALPIFHVFGVYREIFSQTGFISVITIGRATAAYGIVFAALCAFAGIAGIPRTVGFIQPILLMLTVSSSRVFARRWLAGSDTVSPARGAAARILIYGAGAAGRQIAAAMLNSREMRVVGFLDDDRTLHNAVINGTTIYDPTDVRAIAARLGVTDVLLALASVPQRRRNQIIEAMRAASLHVQTLPGIMDLAHGRVSISDIRELEPQDLLGRTPVAADPRLMGRNIHSKTVLVTGAGGSIGSELCRQALAVGPNRLLLVDISEYALYALHQELNEKRPQQNGTPTIIPLLGSVLDEARMRAIVEAWQPDTIYHAAAYKHVPLVEHNPAEGIRNNVFGTATMARVAGELGVADFVLISTDKAVRPTNVMGSTKRAAELALQAYNEVYPATSFSMVRFGNVLGSSGSVVPLFRQQIKNGGPITITDHRITRYFMTIPEAAQLVVQAGAMATGGEVFVLDMGDPVLIADLARSMVELAGLTVRDESSPHGDIEIVEVGLRPGEKLFEELLIGDNPSGTGHPRILMANEQFLPLARLNALFDQLAQQIKSRDPIALVRTLGELVPEYTNGGQIVDWIHLAEGIDNTATAARQTRPAKGQRRESGAVRPNEELS
jgi:FlaA1/EpsC-like NDP-sugar epimerase